VDGDRLTLGSLVEVEYPVKVGILRLALMSSTAGIPVVAREDSGYWAGRLPLQHGPEAGCRVALCHGYCRFESGRVH
jgi:hypothetical protein